MTAQRFMGARNERHAMGGQLFNAFLALSLRTLPLIGLGVVALSLFWTRDLAAQAGPAPAGMKLLADPAHAWGELIRSTRLPPGFIGVLIATEAAAFMSTLSSLINWGSSLVINDIIRPLRRQASARSEIVLSRLATLVLFLAASVVAVLFVEGMVSWFLFINSVMVIFILPLSWLRFFWWRFNVWGEIAAIVLGLPLSILFWFVWDFQSRPFWQGTGLLFLIGGAVLVGVCLLTPPERRETLTAFYERCRPPGRWKPIRALLPAPRVPDRATAALLADCALGILASLGLVLATNAMFAGDWGLFAAAGAGAAVLGGALIRRILVPAADAGGAALPDKTRRTS
jgi:Na+/proline symporter